MQESVKEKEAQVSKNPTNTDGSELQAVWSHWKHYPLQMSQPAHFFWGGFDDEFPSW